MSRKPRSFDQDGKSDKTKALRALVKRQEKEIERLKSELRTLNTAFEKSARFMSSQSKSLSVEQLIAAANKDIPLAEAKLEQEQKSAKEELREKVLKWRNENFGEYSEE